MFLVTAKYCTKAVWQDDRRRLGSELYSRGFLSVLVNYIKSWWYVFDISIPLCDCVDRGVCRRFETTYRPIIMAETWMDFQGEMVKVKAWMRGLLLVGGFAGAHKAAAGLA